MELADGIAITKSDGENEKNAKIAKRVGYKTGDMLDIKGGKKQTQGVRAVQKSYVGAKCMILNIAKGIFPKSSIE